MGERAGSRADRARDPRADDSVRRQGAQVKRERASEKAKRYLAEGHLVIRTVTPESARAECRGDGAIYQVGFQDGRWFCDCPALGRCSHMYALGLVTAFGVRA